MHLSGLTGAMAASGGIHRMSEKMWVAIPVIMPGMAFLDDMDVCNSLTYWIWAMLYGTVSSMFPCLAVLIVYAPRLPAIYLLETYERVQVQMY
jgi:hypothetical protein